MPTAAIIENVPMLTVFEVVVTPGENPSEILSASVVEQTMAQVMTPEDALKLGFHGLRPDPKGRQVRIVAVARRDARWVARELDNSTAVAGYTPHEVD